MERELQRKVLDSVAEQYPEFWHKLYPRRYESPGTYDTAKAAAHAMVDGIFSFIHGKHSQEQGELRSSEQIEAQWAAHLAKNGVPMYYLTYDLADALMKTRPAAVNWQKMKLPFDSAVFMLPKGVFHHPGEGSDVSFVSYSRNVAGTEVEVPVPWKNRTWTLEEMNDGFCIIVRLTNGQTIHWTLNDDFTTIEFNEQLGRLIDQAPHHIHSLRDVELDATDRDVQLKGVILLFNILLFMTSKPEMVEGGAMLRRISKKKKPPIEYWSPRYIGRTYRMRRLGKPESHGGTHASPRGHWVSGFWREQAHGPKFELRRTLWIEPFWRGGDELE